MIFSNTANSQLEHQKQCQALFQKSAVYTVDFSVFY